MGSELAADFVDGGCTFTGGDNLDEILGEYLKVGIGFFETLSEAVPVLYFLGDFRDLLLEDGIIASLCGEIEGLDDRDPGLEEE